LIVCGLVALSGSSAARAQVPGGTGWTAPFALDRPTGPPAQVLPPPPPPEPVPPPIWIPGPGPTPGPALCDDDGVRHFTPFMFGDFIGPVANLFSDVKIAENESPRPVDRVYYRFNYFNNVNKSRWADPAEPIHSVDVFQHVVGFEKTFLNEMISVGVRIPFYAMDAEAKEFRVDQGPGGEDIALPGGPGFDTTHFGNLAAIFKAVLWEDRQTGSLFSAGAIVSVPTASSRKLNPGMSTIAYLAPFGGFIWQQGDLFVHGFSSLTLPVVRAESIVLFNDVGVGYYVYRDDSPSSMVSAIVPTLELHLTNPLRQPDRKVNLFGIVDDQRLSDVFDVTLGTTAVLSNRGTLGVALSVPLTGPKPFDVEVLVQLNYLF
jgi:hypothetical protein